MEPRVRGARNSTLSSAGLRQCRMQYCDVEKSDTGGRHQLRIRTGLGETPGHENPAKPSRNADRHRRFWYCRDRLKPNGPLQSTLEFRFHLAEVPLGQARSWRTAGKSRPTQRNANSFE